MARTTLDRRLASFTTPTVPQQEIWLEQVTQEVQQFATAWGTDGPKLHEALAGIRQTIAEARQYFWQSLQGEGEIAVAQRTRIEASSSQRDTSRLAEVLLDEVLAAVNDTWKQLCAHVHARCIEQLAPLFAATDALCATLRLDQTAPAVLAMLPAPPVLVQSAESQAAQRELLLHSLTDTTRLPTLVAAALGSIRGLLVAWPSPFPRARLHQYLERILCYLQHHFFDADPPSLSHSRMDDYLLTLEHALCEYVQATVRGTAEQTHAELTRLTAALHIDTQQREARIAQTQHHRAVWEEMGEVIQSLRADLSPHEAADMIATMADGAAS